MTDSTPHYAGRRVFCKADGSASSLSRKISLAALPDSKQGFPVRVWSKHASATNVGVKATLIAAERLEKETTPAKTVVAIPSFRGNRTEIELYVEDVDKFAGKTLPTPSETANLTVGGKTDPKLSAGAIANAARERKTPAVQAIGADAVFNAVRAIAIARQYLRDKEDGIDLYFRLEWTKIRFEGRDEDTTAIRFSCCLYEGDLEEVKEE
jgi:stage V sporulation protein S